MKERTLQSRVWIAFRQAVCAGAVIAFSLTVVAPTAEAQTMVGGHIGFVLPLVTRVGGETTNLGDNFAIGFPVGITLKGRGRMAFDMELVSSIQNKPRAVTLTVHPGVVWGVGHGFGVGTRVAFDVNSSQFGFTPLVNKGWPIRT